MAKAPKIVFLHIPKTGGSSLSKALRRHYRFAGFHIKSAESSRAAEWMSGLTTEDPGFLDARQRVRESLILYAAAQDRRFLTGHVWNSPGITALRGTGYRLVTCLRHPVDRWFSNYFYSRYKSGAHGRIELSLEDFLQTRHARDFGTTYVQYLGGIDPDGNYTQASAITRAQQAFDAIDEVAFLDALPAFVALMKQRHGMNLRIPHERKGPLPADEVKRYKESKEIRAAITALCAPDIAVYDYARSRLGP